MADAAPAAAAPHAVRDPELAQEEEAPADVEPAGAEARPGAEAERASAGPHGSWGRQAPARARAQDEPEPDLFDERASAQQPVTVFGQFVLRYPNGFRVLLSTVIGVAILVKLALFVRIVLGVQAAGTSPCRRRDEKLLGICEVVLASFAIFILVRLVASTPCIQVRVDRVHEGLGVFKKYLCHLVLYWPLYVFCFSSHEFLEQFRKVQECADHNQELYTTFRAFGYLCGLVSMVAGFFLIWQVVFIWDTRGHAVQEVRGSPPGTIETLTSVPYSPDDFGDEDGKPYAGICPICLGDWEEDDDIKVPSCGHAFHKDCLRRWLQKGSTCAVCRQYVAPGARPPRRGGASAAPASQVAPLPLRIGRRLRLGVPSGPRQAWQAQ